MQIEMQLHAFLNNLKGISNYSSSTLEAYRNDLTRYLLFLKESIKRNPEITDFTPETISNYLNSERQHGFKPSTLYRRRASLRSFAGFLKNRGIIKTDITEEKQPFMPASDRKLVIDGGDLVSLSDSEVSRFFNVVSSFENPRAKRDFAIINILFEVGISIGDLVTIDMSDFVSQTKSLIIKTKQKKELIHPIPKSAAAIQHYLDYARKDLTQSDFEPALFVSQMGGRVSRQGIWQGIRNWGREAELSLDLSPRIIRHTATKAMIKAGKKIEEIQLLLGHQNIFSTRTLVRRLKRSVNYQY